MAKVLVSNNTLAASTTTQNYTTLLTEQFGDDYTIKSLPDTVPPTFVIKPKNNPSTLQATLSPMFKTRYKYIVIFQESGGVTYRDAYAQNFNRVNGATPEQQQRIADSNRDVEERLGRVEARLLATR